LTKCKVFRRKWKPLHGPGECDLANLLKLRWVLTSFSPIQAIVKFPDMTPRSRPFHPRFAFPFPTPTLLFSPGRTGQRQLENRTLARGSLLVLPSAGSAVGRLPSTGGPEGTKNSASGVITMECARDALPETIVNAVVRRQYTDNSTRFRQAGSQLVQTPQRPSRRSFSDHERCFGGLKQSSILSSRHRDLPERDGMKYLFQEIDNRDHMADGCRADQTNQFSRLRRPQSAFLLSAFLISTFPRTVRPCPPTPLSPTPPPSPTNSANSAPRAYPVGLAASAQAPPTPARRANRRRPAR
jgi:hypothetical protein